MKGIRSARGRSCRGASCVACFRRRPRSAAPTNKQMLIDCQAQDRTEAGAGCAVASLGSDFGDYVHQCPIDLLGEVMRLAGLQLDRVELYDVGGLMVALLGGETQGGTLEYGALRGCDD